ncbi:MAG: winged helix-turn-helix domain-containing protein, partial [Planctomycetia bacterium]
RVVDDGLSCAEVARVLGVAVRSVQTWVRRFRDAGAPGLAAKPHPGRPCRLTLEQEREVKAWLQGSALDHGFATEWWTGARVAAIIQRRFGVAYHPRYLCQWLVAHGQSSQKPQREPKERDPARIAAWIAAWVSDEWPRIKKSGRRRRVHRPDRRNRTAARAARAPQLRAAATRRAARRRSCGSAAATATRCR